ncbi:GDSL-type esterase/lipase family protein [Desulfurivibrio sp. C05AmB]|jgi:lysophospholipase L1-like esterase|uniref:GDSL-type esterase/lipase family protein n=1 Tax=Desulfurivibrio sp. C05AmB TaxID=3374371 RepID=UPI00376F0236
MREIIFIGDSLIEYYDWNDRFPQHRVHNLGWSGETLEGLRTRVGSYEQRPKPDFIFIMSGTNNIAREETGVIMTYREIINQFHNTFPDARIFIHSIPPMLLPWVKPEVITQVNDKLRQLADETGCGYVDIHTLFLQAGVEECLEEDGVHICEKGYEIWSALIEDILKHNP